MASFHYRPARISCFGHRMREHELADSTTCFLANTLEETARALRPAGTIVWHLHSMGTSFTSGYKFRV